MSYICDGRHFGEIVEATFRERGPFNKWYSGRRKVAKIAYCDAEMELVHRGRIVKEGSSFCEGRFGGVLLAMDSVKRTEAYYGITDKTDLKLVLTLNVHQSFVDLNDQYFSWGDKDAHLKTHVQPFACRFIEKERTCRHGGNIACFRVYVSGSGWRVSPETLDRWGQAKLKTGGLYLKARAGK
jgi:hypothetical protein